MVLPLIRPFGPPSPQRGEGTSFHSLTPHERNLLSLEEIHESTGWLYLNRINWSIQSPRPSNPDADPAAQEAFKKTLEEAVEKVAQAHPDKVVEIWAEDEARIGLIPTTRRVWSPRGKRPISSSRRRYKWKYVSGFVHPASGATEWMITDTVNKEMMSEVLENFAKETNAGKEKEIVLVVDGAGWHTSKNLQIPKGIHLVHLPAYSPELQPAECLWPLLRERTANRAWKDLPELTEQIGQRCKQLQQSPQQIARRTHFHWWPKDRRALRPSI